MRHLNPGQLYHSHHQSKGVHTHLTREEISFPDPQPDEFCRKSVPQAFIVEWQMQPAETAKSGNRATIETEPEIYLH